jgi:hypothetical protein
MTEVGYVFFQNYFHLKLSRFTGSQTRCRPSVVLDTGEQLSVAPRQILSRVLRGRRLRNCYKRYN